MLLGAWGVEKERRCLFCNSLKVGRGGVHKSLGVILLISYFTTADHKHTFLSTSHGAGGEGQWGILAGGEELLIRVGICLLCFLEVVLPWKGLLQHVNGLLGFVMVLQYGKCEGKGSRHLIRMTFIINIAFLVSCQFLPHSWINQNSV